MKRTILGFSLIFSLIFSYSYNYSNKINQPNVELLSENNNNCKPEYAIVNITTQSNLINVSGFIIHKQNSEVYIATSYLHYNREYNYEVIFNDYSRYSAIVAGVAKEDEILILKVKNIEQNYCSVETSRTHLINKLEEVDILGAYNYKLAKAKTYVSAVGLCKNCNEDTFKNYYYSLLTLDMPFYFIGAGVFDKSGKLLGIITNELEQYNLGVSMLDVDKLKAIVYSIVNDGIYVKNYIKYNLLNVNSLTNYEKYLYSLSEELTNGVLVSSVHYLNYFNGGLNQGMVIYGVNGVSVSNCYQLDTVISWYPKGSLVRLNVRTITNKIKTIHVKI